MSEISIIVNVYDLHESNRLLHNVGTGFYHTGVEVNGYEYSFSENGVVRTSPRLSDFGVLREQLQMGYFTGGMGGINSLISALRNERFQPGTYDIVHLNCNHFSDAFCFRALGVHLPEWVNRAASVGSNFVRNKSSTTTESFPALGHVKDPEISICSSSALSHDKLNSDQQQRADPKSSSSGNIFSWLGWGSSNNDFATNDRKSNSRTVQKPSDKKELTAKQKEMLARMKKS